LIYRTVGKRYSLRTYKADDGAKPMKLRVGDQAPDFTLPSHLDKDVTLSDYQGKTTVLVFFPRAFTPV
jgi:peroxiredoxin